MKIKSAKCSWYVAQGCCAVAMLEHPAFADCHASRRRALRCRRKERVHVPTEVSKLLIDTLESHAGFCGVVLRVG